MARTYVISPPRNRRWVNITEWYVGICQGAPNPIWSAILLDIFEYWHNWKTEYCLRNKKKLNKKNLSIFKSMIELKVVDLFGIMNEGKGVFGDKAISDNLEWLIQAGYLDRFLDEDNPVDRTYRYFFVADTVQEAVDKWDKGNPLIKELYYGIEPEEEVEKKEEPKRKIPPPLIGGQAPGPDPEESKKPQDLTDLEKVVAEISKAKSITFAMSKRLNEEVYTTIDNGKIISISPQDLWDQDELYEKWILEKAVPHLKSTMARKSNGAVSRTNAINYFRRLDIFHEWRSRNHEESIVDEKDQAFIERQKKRFGLEDEDGS